MKEQIKLNKKFISNDLKSMIYLVRNQRVMLDFELAKIYGYETKNFNRQIKNNIKKFDEDFRFKLTKSEWNEILRCKNFTSSWGGRRDNPFVFTEMGVYMLMTILKGDLATEQSKSLIRTFKILKDFAIENKDIIEFDINYFKILKQVNSNTQKIEYIENKFNFLLDNFTDKNIFKHNLILNGQKIEADIGYQAIYKLATKSIYIIDNYIDIKTLQLLKVSNKSVEIIIFTDYRNKNNLNSTYLNDFTSDTGNVIKFKENNGIFHDRYIIIDFNTSNESIFHCGASSKDAGKKITTITKIEDINAYDKLIKSLLINKEIIIF